MAFAATRAYPALTAKRYYLLLTAIGTYIGGESILLAPTIENLLYFFYLYRPQLLIVKLFELFPVIIYPKKIFKREFGDLFFGL